MSCLENHHTHNLKIHTHQYIGCIAIVLLTKEAVPHTNDNHCFITMRTFNTVLILQSVQTILHMYTMSESTGTGHMIIVSSQGEVVYETIKERIPYNEIKDDNDNVYFLSSVNLSKTKLHSVFKGFICAFNFSTPKISSYPTTFSSFQ